MQHHPHLAFRINSNWSQSLKRHEWTSQSKITNIELVHHIQDHTCCVKPSYLIWVFYQELSMVCLAELILGILSAISSRPRRQVRVLYRTPLPKVQGCGSYHIPEPVWWHFNYICHDGRGLEQAPLAKFTVWPLVLSSVALISLWLRKGLRWIYLSVLLSPRSAAAVLALLVSELWTSVWIFTKVWGQSRAYPRSPLEAFLTLH